MTQARVLAAVAAVCMIASPSGAVEVFQWTDEDGVVHFSDERPTEAVERLTHFVIAARNPRDYDPADDEYSIRNQAARVNELYRKIEERREARSEKRAAAAARSAQSPQQFARIYDEPLRSYFVPVYRPIYPSATIHKNHHFPNQHYSRPRPFEEPQHERPPPARRRPPPGRMAPPPATPKPIPARPVRWAPSQHPR